MMIKEAIFLLFFITISKSASELKSMECNNQYKTWGVLSNIYTCQVLKGVSIISLESAYFDTATGSHQIGHTNNNVNYLYFEGVTVAYFPRGIETIFKNLKAIYFYIAGLKEIHQSDLKPFPNLVEFGINTNPVEIIEEGLFDFNPNLEYVSLANNKIIHIDSKVFDSLKKLRHLYPQGNTCFDKYARDRTAVVNLMKEIKTTCNNSEYSGLDYKLKYFESKSELLNFGEFKTEFENLESKVNASKFVSFYQAKLQSLKIIFNKKSMNEKVVNINENMLSLSQKFLKIEEQMSNFILHKEHLNGFNENLTATNKNCEKINNEVASIKDVAEKIEKNLIQKMDEDTQKLSNKIDESEKNFNESASKILKVLMEIFADSDNGFKISK